LLISWPAGYVLNGSKAIADTAAYAAWCHARSRWIAWGVRL
jgi:hypothetical protein